MSRNDLASQSVEQLVRHFLDLTLGQFEAERRDEIAKYNRLFREMRRTREELARRPGDQRRALAPLLEHPNAQVRLMAAIATLAIYPQDARRILQEISDRNEYPQAVNAREMLRALDKGTYVPG